MSAARLLEDCPEAVGSSPFVMTPRHWKVLLVVAVVHAVLFGILAGRSITIACQGAEIMLLLGFAGAHAFEPFLSWSPEAMIWKGERYVADRAVFWYRAMIGVALMFMAVTIVQGLTGL